MDPNALTLLIRIKIYYVQAQVLELEGVKAEKESLALRVLEASPWVGGGNPVPGGTIEENGGLIGVGIGWGVCLGGWLKDDLELMNQRRIAFNFD